MPSTTKEAETTAYENVQSNPFARAIAEMVTQINPSNPFTQVLAEMATQIKVLTAAVMQFTATKENSNPNATRGNGGSNRKSRQPHMKKLFLLSCIKRLVGNKFFDSESCKNAVTEP
jgi:hypothetical protein